MSEKGVLSNHRILFNDLTLTLTTTARLRARGTLRLFLLTFRSLGRGRGGKNLQVNLVHTGKDHCFLYNFPPDKQLVEVFRTTEQGCYVQPPGSPGSFEDGHPHCFRRLVATDGVRIDELSLRSLIDDDDSMMMMMMMMMMITIIIVTIIIHIIITTIIVIIVNIVLVVLLLLMIFIAIIMIVVINLGL